jgi:hypothetical protein
MIPIYLKLFIICESIETERKLVVASWAWVFGGEVDKNVLKLMELIVP